MNREIIVIDGFYHDPDAIREFALSQEFGVKGNYPGMRTETFVEDDVRAHLERIMNINIDEMHWKVGEYTGSFQYVTKDTPTWVHADTATDLSLIHI